MRHAKNGKPHKLRGGRTCSWHLKRRWRTRGEEDEFTWRREEEHVRGFTIAGLRLVTFFLMTHEQCDNFHQSLKPHIATVLIKKRYFSSLFSQLLLDALPIHFTSSRILHVPTVLCRFIIKFSPARRHGRPDPSIHMPASKKLNKISSFRDRWERRNQGRYILGDIAIKTQVERRGRKGKTWWRIWRDVRQGERGMVTLTRPVASWRIVLARRIFNAYTYPNVRTSEIVWICVSTHLRLSHLRLGQVQFSQNEWQKWHFLTVRNFLRKFHWYCWTNRLF